jgi:hypothetical protein
MTEKIAFLRHFFHCYFEENYYLCELIIENLIKIEKL